MGLMSLAVMDGTTMAVIVAVSLLVVLFIFIMVYAARYVKVGPNEVLIISGRKNRYKDASGRDRTRGFRVQAGGGTFVWPVLEKAEILSLELMTVDIKTPSVYTVTGVPIRADGVAQMKVKGDELSIGTAAEQFLSKSPAQIKHVALETLEGHLRAIIGQLTVEQIYKDRDAFAQKVQEGAAGDFANMGLQIVSFTLKDVRDDEGYLDALGKPRIAEVKRDAIIGQAEADRDATIKSAMAHQLGQEARFKAETQVAEAQRDYETQRANYQEDVNQAKAKSDLAYDLQKNMSAQAVKLEEMKVVEIEKERMIEIKQKELNATVEKPAEAEKRKIEKLAEAERFRIEQEASGRANAARDLGVGEADGAKARGLAEAEVTRANGMAEAEVILSKGQSEAQAMDKKAAAWKQYNEAAIAQMLIERLPELAKAIAAPLGNVDKITIVSAGENGGLGASKLTGDVVNMIAQLPPVLEGVSGINLKDLLSKIPALGKKGDGKSSDRK